MAAEPFSSFSTSRETRFDSQPFRFLLLRRLRLPSPLTTCRCQCGRLLDVFGHHRAACATVGVSGRRGFALESAAARVCRGRGKSEDERACAGTRPPPRPEPPRRSAFGSGGGRFGALQRGPIGSGHHFGSQHSAHTGPFLAREQQWVEKPSEEPGHGRRVLTQNSLAREDAPHWWSLLQKWVDVGQTKLPSSCVLWHGPKRSVLRSPPKPKWHTHGIGDGGNSWHAQQQSRSRTRCWSTRRQLLPVTQHPQRLI